MKREEPRLQSVAVSGSAVAEMRRHAVADAGMMILLVDAGMRVRLAFPGASTASTGDALIGVRLIDAVDASTVSGGRLEHAVRQAHSGAEAQLPLSSPNGKRRSLRCLPLAGSDAGAPMALVVISDEREAEFDELRARADDLEALAGAARALARSTYTEDAQQTVCEAAAGIAGSEVAALLELRGDGSEIVVAAATGADLEGQSAPLADAALAARAFSGDRPSFSAHLDSEEEASAWPLRVIGAHTAIWQPVRRSVGIRGVIAVGWQRPTSPPSERLLSSLELLAGEAAVAIDRAAALERLTGMARTDPLTELSNRRGWQDELVRELARAERGELRLSIGLIDLDELKPFNDRWGHAAGDRLLLTAAARWRRRLRLTDMLARIGGDEFAVTMPGCSLSEGTAVADQLRAALPEGLSCSVGVAEWSRGESPAELLSRADEALYAAKNSGRDATFSLAAPSAAQSRPSVPSP